MAAKANSGMKWNQPGGCGWQRQRGCSGQRDHGPAEDLQFGKTTQGTG